MQCITILVFLIITVFWFTNKILELIGNPEHKTAVYRGCSAATGQRRLQLREKTNYPSSWFFLTLRFDLSAQLLLFPDYFKDDFKTDLSLQSLQQSDHQVCCRNIYDNLCPILCQVSSLQTRFSPWCRVLIGHFLVSKESWEPEEFKTVLACLISCI